MQPKYYGAAADYNKPTGGGFKFNGKIALIAGGAILLIVLLLVGTSLINSLSSATQNSLATLVAREEQLQTILENKNRENIKNGDLSRVAADANLLIISDTQALSDALSKSYGLAAVPATVTAAETDKTYEDKFKEATQVGTFDSVFVDTVRSKIASSISQAEQLRSQVKASVKDIIEKNITNLKSIDEQLEALNL